MWLKNWVLTTFQCFYSSNIQEVHWRDNSPAFKSDRKILIIIIIIA